jgi:hypothetical protein
MTKKDLDNYLEFLATLVLRAIRLRKLREKRKASLRKGATGPKA